MTPHIFRYSGAATPHWKLTTLDIKDNFWERVAATQGLYPVAPAVSQIYFSVQRSVGTATLFKSKWDPDSDHEGRQKLTTGQP